MSRTISEPVDGCCCMTSRSASVSGPGLEEDRVGHGDLADVVQQEAELDLRVVAEAHARRPRASASP